MSSEYSADYLDDGLVHFRARGSRRSVGVRRRDIAEEITGILVADEHWRIDYNQNRPHTSLGGLTPDAFAAQLNPARIIA